MRAGPSHAAAVALLIPLLAGCVEPLERYYGFDADAQYKNPGVFPGNYSIDGSNVLVGGNLTPDIPVVVRITSARPAFESVASSLSDAEVDIVLAYWLPKNQTKVGRVPVIVDAGPYYEIGTHDCPFGDPKCRPGERVNDTIDWPQQMTPFLLRNYLPKGYAVAQVAVRGTGTAGGCMDLLGPDEQHDLDQAITWLGSQDWSNGNVGMIGVSYDGSTPWEVAATGNPHLKTIVPISGLPDIYDLMFRNGSAETRGPIMHNMVYWGYGFNDEWPYNHVPGGWPDWPLPVPPPVPWAPRDPIRGEANGRKEYQDLQNLVCRDVVEGSAVAALSSTLGGRWEEQSAYWTERDHRAGVLANYKGSVFLVHGLQDWNVDPHAAIPFNLQLRTAGIEVKEWYGQWDHNTPDGQCAMRSPDYVTLPCRIDWAEVLGRWFDRYLKGDSSQDLGPSIQVEDNVGFWRNADSFPPAAPAWVPLHLTGDNRLAGEGGPEATVTLDPPRGGPAQVVELKGEPLAEDLRISGLPRLSVPFKATGEGGMLGAWLFDENATGRVRAPFWLPPDRSSPVPEERHWRPAGIPVVGHAQMNLRYYAGGEEAQTLTPGERYVARMEFEPMEVLVPKGHRLVLWLFQYAYPDHSTTATPAPIEVTLGGSDTVLDLSTIDVDPKTVFPVPGIHFPERSHASHKHVSYPGFPGGVAGTGIDAPATVGSAGTLPPVTGVTPPVSCPGCGP